MPASATRGRFAYGLATTAVLCAAAFTAWVLVAPVGASGATVLEDNAELSVWLALAAPLVVTSGVWLLLRVACRDRSRPAKIAGSALAWLLLAFAVISGLSVGMFVLPAAVGLVAAATLTPASRA